MKAIVVDDEVYTLEEITEIIQQFANAEVVGAYTNPSDALTDLETTNPDCAFLDIEMPVLNGIELADRLLAHNPHMDIVFITAYNRYATEAFEINALDYVLKPICPERFAKTVERLNQAEKKVPRLENTAVEIRTLGGFEVLVGGQAIRWSRSKAKELLAYLLHYSGQKRNKFKICEDLWPECEPKKSLINLQTTICTLRKNLGDAGWRNAAILFCDESYELKLGSIVCDFIELEKLYEEYRIGRSPSTAKKTLALYHGEYMDGEDWTWAQLRAENLRRYHDRLLGMLTKDYYKREQFHEAIETAVRLLDQQAFEADIQLILLDSAYQIEGINGVAHYAKMLERLCQNQFDGGLEPKVLTYCREKGVIV